MPDDESRGVHLSDKQIVFVFMAGTVAAVVFFLFGVFVGRGVHQARGPITDGGMAAATELVPDGMPGEPPVADGAPRSGSGGSGGDELSYPERLGKTLPAGQLKPAPPPADERPRDTAPPEVPAEPLAPPRAAATPPAASAPAPAPALWTVQLAAVNRREEADAIVTRLKTKGYGAYVFVPDGANAVGGFRVRIGSFKDKRQANALAELLLREEKRYKPWVTR
jgi:cell division septation protein DedD